MAEIKLEVQEGAEKEFFAHLMEKFDEEVEKAAELRQKRYFTRDEAVKYLALKASCFNDHVRYSIPVAMIGTRLVFDRKDLDEFIEQHKT
ncbi:hypothetical protein GNF18_07975 [Ligilactobacillus pobuzihii]|uniref:hypothetical protein n=1 Tax=Ligilactobacillus pobuzihii TaxID=449659 RepID=UPI0019D24938|nr:hypothetical protein [Ligilactobacillus pobuzihii]MBN7275072.1 hypothetical protein [Ligilactobacillus pobuzihii]